jgi:hypothetical protein
LVVVALGQRLGISGLALLGVFGLRGRGGDGDVFFVGCACAGRTGGLADALDLCRGSVSIEGNWAKDDETNMFGNGLDNDVHLVPIFEDTGRRRLNRLDDCRDIGVFRELLWHRGSDVLNFGKSNGNEELLVEGWYSVMAWG